MDAQAPARKSQSMRLSMFLTVAGLLGPIAGLSDVAFGQPLTCESLFAMREEPASGEKTPLVFARSAESREEVLALASLLVRNGVGVPSAVEILMETPAIRRVRTRLASALTALEYAVDRDGVALRLHEARPASTDPALANWLDAAARLQAQGLKPRPPLESRIIDSSKIISKERRDAFFLGNLRGDATRSELYFQWNVSNPDSLFATGDGRFEVRSQEKTSVEYRGSAANEAQPFLGVRRLFSMPVPQVDFYRTVYGNYENRIRDDLVHLVEEVERGLPGRRASWGEVHNRESLDVLGTLRLFDGSALLRSDLFDSRPDLTESGSKLVFQRIFEARGIDYKWKKLIAEIKRKHPFKKVFELGKFSLDKSAPATDRDRTLLLLEFFMLDHYVSRYPDALYFAHTASEAHNALYKRRWGFTVVEKVPIPGTDKHEYILMVTAQRFRKVLERRITAAEKALAVPVEFHGQATSAAADHQ